MEFTVKFKTQLFSEIETRLCLEDRFAFKCRHGHRSSFTCNQKSVTEPPEVEGESTAEINCDSKCSRLLFLLHISPKGPQRWLASMKSYNGAEHDFA